MYRREHFLYGDGQPDRNRAADDAVPDIQFDQVRNLKQPGNVCIAKTMPRVDAQTRLTRGFVSLMEAVNFVRAFFLAMVLLGKRAGMKFDEIGSDFTRGGNLIEVRRDKQTHFYAGLF